MPTQMLPVCRRLLYLLVVVMYVAGCSEVLYSRHVDESGWPDPTLNTVLLEIDAMAPQRPAIKQKAKQALFLLPGTGALSCGKEWSVLAAIC